MKRYVIILLLLSLSNTLVAQTNKDSTINWLSFEQLSDSLKTNPKKVLLFFHTDWCTYCNKMMKETFTNPSIVNKINQEYYAVHFDAESTEEIKFDNIILKNTSKKKIRGKYHQIVDLFFLKNNISFPKTILLNKDFIITKNTNKYLSIKDLNKIL